MTDWDILITSIPHRHRKLLALLEHLDAQLRDQEQVGAILYRDDLEVPYGDKTRALIEASAAGYVSSFDDDDSCSPDFIRSVTAALREKPDYVGFMVRWTQNGEPRIPVRHSLEAGGWHDTPWELQRDIAQFNPLRRTLAMPEAWHGGWEAERRWSDAVRASGLVVTEEFIGDEMYYYQNNTHDTFQTDRRPLGYMPVLPGYPWLRQIGPYS